MKKIGVSNFDCAQGLSKSETGIGGFPLTQTLIVVKWWGQKKVTHAKGHQGPGVTGFTLQQLTIDRWFPSKLPLLEVPQREMDETLKNEGSQSSNFEGRVAPPT